MTAINGRISSASGRRGLRADARRNREHVLAAAREVFVEQGADAPLDEIARRAGVGIATLYRRFPDRAALLRAVALDVRLAHRHLELMLAGLEAQPASSPPPLSGPALTLAQLQSLGGDGQGDLST